MKILLDTSVAIWAICDTQKIPINILEQISDANNEIFVSNASVWEIAIKNISKPNKIPIGEKNFIGLCHQASFEFLPIKIKHILELRNLQFKQDGFTHKDPFDNMLISQSICEEMKLYTSDKTFINYNYNNIVTI